MIHVSRTFHFLLMSKGTRLAECLAARPLQEESVGSDLAEEHEPTGPKIERAGPGDGNAS